MIRVAVEAQRVSSFVAQGQQFPSYKTKQGSRYDARTQVSLNSASNGWVEQDINMLFKTGDYLFTVPVTGKTNNYSVTIELISFLDKLNDALKTQSFTVPTFQQVLMNALLSEDVKCSCTCPDYIYRFSFVSTLNDDNSGRPQAVPAPITNPANTKGSCKHILHVLTNRTWVPRVARNLFNYIIDIWKNKRSLFDQIIRPALNDITDDKILGKFKSKIQEEVIEKIDAQGVTESLDEQAVVYFGTTYSPKLAGFILPDGQMLDFSAGQGYRCMDHRDISELYEDVEENEGSIEKSGTDYLIDFMHRTGAIRVDFESHLIDIDIAHKPTDIQYDKLSYFIDRGGETGLDLSDRGIVVASVMYEGRNSNPVRIIGDIKNYFKTKKLPQVATEAVNSYYAGNQLYSPDQEFALAICEEIGADVRPYVTPENTPEQIEEIGQAYKSGVPFEVVQKLSDPTIPYITIRVIAEGVLKGIDLLPYASFAPDVLEEILKGCVDGVPIDKLALPDFTGRQVQQLAKAYKIDPQLYIKVCNPKLSYLDMSRELDCAER